MKKFLIILVSIGIILYITRVVIALTLLINTQKQVNDIVNKCNTTMDYRINY